MIAAKRVQGAFMDITLNNNYLTMKLLLKHRENLIVQKALNLFFYNFNTYPIVEEMEKEDSGFKNAWGKLIKASKEEHDKKGGMWIIDYTEIYKLYNFKLTYKAQALLLEKVLHYYKDEAKKAVDFSIKIEETKAKQILNRNK